MAVLHRTKGGEDLIPVTPQPEPRAFNAMIRKPGQKFLRKVPHPNQKQFHSHQYWKESLPELRRAYSEVCAYCACWIPFDQGSVDHFIPRSVDPGLAYEWSNFRLAQERINSNKGDSTDVLDPFHIQVGWFVLDCASFFVKPNAGLNPQVERAVNTTIQVLQLNADTFVRLRYNVLREYSHGNWTLDFLERRYPFVASELKRQGLVESIKGTVP